MKVSGNPIIFRISFIPNGHPSGLNCLSAGLTVSDEELSELAVEKGTPVMKDATDALRDKAVVVTKDVLKRLEKAEKAEKKEKK